jgi:hypothetical protein
MSCQGGREQLTTEAWRILYRFTLLPCEPNLSSLSNIHQRFRTKRADTTVRIEVTMKIRGFGCWANP